jgi:hypothetical protein
MIFELRQLRFAATVGIGLAVPASAADPPDSKLNPQSASIEIAAPVWSGGNYDVHHVINHGIGVPQVSVVSSDPRDDRGPRIAVSGSGDTWVVWWRDEPVDRVVARRRTYGNGSWSAERVLSDPGTGSRHPSIVHDGTSAWVAFEFDADQGAGVGVNVITDEPDPIPDCTLLGISSYAGARDVLIQAAGGQLWVSWIDAPAVVAWSEYDRPSGVWSVVGYETAADGVAAARYRIRNRVLAN